MPCLIKAHKQFLSADRAPNKLSRIQERIKSRFSGGLVVDIQKPDFELRKKLLQIKQKNLEVCVQKKSIFHWKYKIL